MGSIFKLIIEDDEGKTTVVPVSRGEISIGRMEGNTIRLMERNVSRRHARLLRENGAVFIEDLNSFNGVKINGERVDKRIEIKEGDLVEIGDYHLALQAAEIADELPELSRTIADQPTGQLLGGSATISDVPWKAPAGDDRTGDAGVQPRAVHIPKTPDGGSVREPIGATIEIAKPPDLFSGTHPLVSPPSKERASLPVLPPFPSGLGSSGHSGTGTLPDTNMLSTLAQTSSVQAPRTEQIQVGPSRLADVARLICVSTEYAGREFSLNRPEVIIGRVEDNDVVIEHRSVSRNHAKILFDGRVHKIIDLESANGILVNGEEYAITDLRGGDLIELGHVRFRFLPAAESFAPTDEEVRAMLAAGVPPPRGPELKLRAPPAVSRETGPPGSNGEILKRIKIEPQPLGAQPDPSNAATVTDTPIGVLWGNQSAPEPKPIASPDGPLLGQPALPEVPPGVPARSSSPPAIPSAANLARANTNRTSTPTTDVRNPPPAPPARTNLRMPDAAEEEHATEVLLGKTWAKKWALIASAVVLVGGLLLYSGMKLSERGDDTADRELQSLYDKGDYEGVQTFFIQNVRRFADSDHASDLAKRATEMRDKTKFPSDAAPPSSELDKARDDRAGPRLRPEILPQDPTAEMSPEGELPSDDVDKNLNGQKRPGMPGPAPGPKAPRRDLDRAKGYERMGLKAMFEGDLTKAERLLQLCLKNYDYAPCHKNLGILYAQLDQTKLSIRHYEKYVQLAPSAPDAEKVREMIEQVRGNK